MQLQIIIESRAAGVNVVVTSQMQLADDEPQTRGVKVLQSRVDNGTPG